MCQIFPPLEGRGVSGREVREGRQARWDLCESEEEEDEGYSSQHPPPSQVCWGLASQLEILAELQFSIILAGNVGFYF